MAGLTQDELARRIYVKQCTVCNWERGRSRPSAILVPKIAAALDISAKEVVEATKENGKSFPALEPERAQTKEPCG